MNAEEIKPRSPWIAVALWGFAALTSTVALALVTHSHHPLIGLAVLIGAIAFAWAGHRAEKADRR